MEEADREIHEYIENKLMEEHGVKDEAERPGITGPKTEARPKPSIEAEPAVADQPSVKPGTGGDTPSAHQGASAVGRRRARRVRARAPKEPVQQFQLVHRPRQKRITKH